MTEISRKKKRATTNLLSVCNNTFTMTLKFRCKPQVESHHFFLVCNKKLILTETNFCCYEIYLEMYFIVFYVALDTSGIQNVLPVIYTSFSRWKVSWPGKVINSNLFKVMLTFLLPANCMTICLLNDN